MPFRINKPAFLVEGVLEQKFVQATCPSAPVRRIGCNGDDVAIEAIAERVGTQARLLQRKYNPIVVVFDREGRDVSCDDIRARLLELLKTEGLTGDIVVGIPDRDIETWILADFERFLEAAGVQPEMVLDSFEGIKGKSRIRAFLKDGRPYVETVQGVAWLKNSRPAILRKTNRSFSKLFDELVALDCWWLQQSELL